jgi:putative tributyrin esterase
MRDVIFFSSALKRDMPYRVFLPTTIAAGRKLPVVYLLHGGGGNFRDWSNNSDVSRYAQQGMILVMPEGYSSYYTNAALHPADKYQNYLINDLISDVERRFPAAGSREGRAIVGVSMGGFAAVKLALSRPDLFAFAGALSPAIDVPSRRFTWRRASQSWHFRTVFGPQRSATRKASDPFLLVRSSDPAVTPYLYLTAGEREPLLEPNQRFASILHARHFQYEFHTRPGGHDWGEWDSQIPGCFESLLTHIPQSR